MAMIVVCDVCGSETPMKEWTGGIEMRIPNQMLGELGDEVGEYIMCSWECAHTLTVEFAQPVEDSVTEPVEDEVEEAEEPRPAPRRRMRPVEQTVDTGIQMDHPPVSQTLADYVNESNGGKVTIRR